MWQCVNQKHLQLEWEALSIFSDTLKTAKFYTTSNLFAQILALFLPVLLIVANPDGLWEAHYWVSSNASQNTQQTSQKTKHIRGFTNVGTNYIISLKGGWFNLTLKHWNLPIAFDFNYAHKKELKPYSFSKQWF